MLESIFAKESSQIRARTWAPKQPHHRNNVAQPPKRASGNERPLKQGGGGHPPATLCVRAFSRESLDPPPGTGRETTPQVLTCAGPNQPHPKGPQKHPPPGIRRGVSYSIDGTRAAGSGLPLTQTRPVPGPCREPSPLQCSGGCCASTYGAPPQRGCLGSPAGRARR